jgi:dTMP kinase
VAEPQPPGDLPATYVSDLPTEALPGIVDKPSRVRLFGTKAYFRLWVAQVIASLGDWIGLVAVISIAARVGGASPDAAVGLVMSARIIPGFFLASMGGVFVDRWDRKKVMVRCNIGRGLVLATLPFLENVWGLFLVSFVLELLTLLWSSAKEASVPNLVSTDQLTTANSLSLVAAYGTFPIGAAVFAGLATVADVVGRNVEALDRLSDSKETLAIFANVATFFISAAIISTIALPRTQRGTHGRIDLGRAFHEIHEGWSTIRSSAVVTAVMIGLGTGLMGGGMVVPLGPRFSKQVLQGGEAGFGLLLTAMGMGVAAGVVTVSALQKKLPRERFFPMTCIGAGVCMIAAASMSSLPPAMLLVAGMGMCAGAGYVVGFTILHESVEDEMRGRVFAALYTLVRLCLIIALAIAPFLSGALDGLSSEFLDRSITVGAFDVSLPGARLTLWLGGAITLLAGVLANRIMRRHLQAVAAHAPYG